MFVYFLMFFCLIVNAFLFSKKPKMFVVFSFLVLFLVSAFRNETVGIDLAGHYADNYRYISKLKFTELLQTQVDLRFYDLGLIVFMWLLGQISASPLFFIFVTSFIVCFLVGRYIYCHSDDMILETFIFVLSFSYFMFMNIIAQALAIAVILYAIEALFQKKYLKFCLITIIACLLHSSAIICFVFLPLRMLKPTKKNVQYFVILSVVVLWTFDWILPIVTKYIFPQFEYYLNSGYTNSLDRSRLAHLLLYCIFLAVAVVMRYSVPSRYVEDPRNRNRVNTKTGARLIKSRSLPYNFLFYSTILSIVCRLLVVKLYIFSRMGFFFYPLAASLVTQAVNGIRIKRMRQFVRGMVILVMFLFFLSLINSLKSSYGVLPYMFYWDGK